MIKKKKDREQREERKRRTRNACGTRSSTLKVIPVGLAHLARYFRREGVDACLGESRKSLRIFAKRSRVRGGWGWREGDSLTHVG